MINSKRFIVVAALLIVAGLFMYLHADIKVPMNRPFSDFPIRHLDWHMVSQAVFSANILAVLKPTDYLDRKYVNESGLPIELYIGYHGGGEGGGEIHSPKNCMLGSGWREGPEQQITIPVGDRKLQVNKAVYQNNGMNQLLLYWYEVKGRPLTSEYALKAHEIVNSAFYRRKDAAFISVSLIFDSDEEKAVSSGVKFINDFYPKIREFLPK
jgi:EpsI family protein